MSTWPIARTLMWPPHAFNRLARHVRSDDMGGIEPGEDLASLGKVEEFCLLTEDVERENYPIDPARFRNTSTLTDLDLGWERYFEKSGDPELLQVAAPLFAFRGLVMSSPIWYPSLADGVRRKLLALMLNVLESDIFDAAQVNAYCGA